MFMNATTKKTAASPFLSVKNKVSAAKLNRLIFKTLVNGTETGIAAFGAMNIAQTTSTTNGVQIPIPFSIGLYLYRIPNN